MTTLQTKLTNKISIKFIGDSISTQSTQGMSVLVKVNAVEVDHVPNLIGEHRTEFFHTYPMTIEIIVNGKEQHDTEVNDAGVIIKDKHVLISTLHIAGVPVNYWMLEKCVVDFNGRFTNYLGENGTAMIQLPKLNAIENHLRFLAANN
jgi:hypothetical protein